MKSSQGSQFGAYITDPSHRKRLGSSSRVGLIDARLVRAEFIRLRGRDHRLKTKRIERRASTTLARRD